VVVVVVVLVVVVVVLLLVVCVCVGEGGRQTLTQPLSHTPSPHKTSTCPW
jgi:hypothetical protein